MTDTTTQFKRQLPRNSFFQVLAFISHVAIGIWLVPYLVKHLGRAAYGLIPIAGMMTQYVALISRSISSAVNRFLTIALQQNDTKEANRIFNTAFFSYLAIGLMQIPVFWLVISHANTIFSIPQELYRDVIVLLVCSAASFLINLVCSVFAVPMQANNRLDIARGLDVARLTLRLAGIVTLFVIFRPALRYVGYVDLTLTLTLCLIRIQIARQLAPKLRIAFVYYDWHKVRELTGMGGWLLVNHLAFLLLLRVDIWVCNRFVSPEAAGDYAAVLQWSNLIRQGGTVLAGLTAPMTMIYYARSEIRNLIRLSKVSVRVLSLALAIPISVLCAFSKPLLSLWLGESFSRLWPLMVIVLCHLVVNVGVYPLFSVQVALNKVRWPGMVAFTMGLLNIFLSIAFVKHLQLGIYGVAIAGALVLTLRNAFLTPIYAAFILHLPWHVFLTSYMASIAFFAALSTFGYLLNYCLYPASWGHMVVVSAVIGVVGLLAAWAILPRRDRVGIMSLFPSHYRTVVA